MRHVINTDRDGGILFLAHPQCAKDYVATMSAADRPLVSRPTFEKGPCHLCEETTND